MMNTTLLARNGMLLNDQEQEVARPLSVLAGRVRLGEGYSLRSFFEMMRRYPQLQEISVFIPPFMEECAGCPESGCVNEGLTHLELVKRVEMVGFPGEPRFNFLCSLTGWHNTTEQELRIFQLHQMLDTPIRLGMLKHSVFGDTVNMMEFDTDYSLFEFIEGIAWQLGFQRYPEHCSIKG